MSYDYQNCLNYAVETAVEAAVKAAIKDATEKSRCETAKNMLHDNAPVDLISKYTGLTKEQILKLKSE